ncbi:putative quinol monooxygenase [Hyunsoonleella ulvae]|uniref:putative quinol monooxygenase n=1 Tax=Hyunsoonleella ulvae TaxID=2799948 RepID=UPI0019394542|nr:antibiotic biosynthesis monooxygenase family protein [Hyunsoonleella ulvae]
MLIRIVKMSFKAECVDDFLDIFEKNKTRIRGYEGCNFLELYRDKTQPNIFFTYSYWNSETDLELYRNSDIFKSIWSKTKILFNAKPEAWSVDKSDTLE